MNGQGFFQVQMPDGTTSYTRDGSFQVGAQGQLVNSSGYAVSPGITMPANTQSITIGRDGIVSVTVAGTTAPQQIGQIQLANFMNPAGLDHARRQPVCRNLCFGQPADRQPRCQWLGRGHPGRGGKL